MADLTPGAPDPLAGRIPLTLLTGFLGSGKTTVLSRLLRHPGMNRAAVIINEFGDVGIDHQLVSASSEQMTLLSNGCLCCTVRTDLQETLRELFVKRRAGEIIDFDRVFVETTGLADPIPVLHTLQTDTMLGAQYRLNGVVTMVDAVNGEGQLDTMPEAAKQAAVADLLLLTKTDLATAEQISRLEARLAAMNPYARLLRVVQGDVDPQLLTDIGPSGNRGAARLFDSWLDASANAGGATPADGAYLNQRLAPRRGPHDAAIHSFCLWFDQPFSWEVLTAALNVLTAMRGPDLLRVKGIVNVTGEAGPVILQGAQHVFHPPVTLDAWRDGDHRSRIVFIVRNISRDTIEALFRAVGALGTNGAATGATPP